MVLTFPVNAIMCLRNLRGKFDSLAGKRQNTHQNFTLYGKFFIRVILSIVEMYEYLPYFIILMPARFSNYMIKRK